MNKNPLIEKLLSESIDDKINELTSKLDSKVNIMEIDAYDLEYEETYELDNSKGKPKRVIFKGRGKKGKGDSTTQTYHFEDGTRKKLVKYTEQKYAHIDGLGDCIRYGIHHLFPIQHDQMGPNYVTDDKRYHQNPGAKYMPVSPLYPGGPTWEELLEGEQQDYQTWAAN